MSVDLRRQLFAFGLWAVAALLTVFVADGLAGIGNMPSVGAAIFWGILVVVAGGAMGALLMVLAGFALWGVAAVIVDWAEKLADWLDAK